MAALATLDDFIRLGLPATALVPSPREIETIDVGTGYILTKGHGLVTGDVVRFEGQGVLPAPLAPATNYTATTVDIDLFTISFAGNPVTFTNTGAKPYAWRVVPYPAILAAILAASSVVQDHARAHSTIVEPTEQIKQIVCILAAHAIVTTNRLKLAITKDFYDLIQGRYADAWITLRSWEKGRSIAGVVDATPNVAEFGAITGGPSAGVEDWGWGVGL